MNNIVDRNMIHHENYMKNVLHRMSTYEHNGCNTVFSWVQYIKIKILLQALLQALLKQPSALVK